MFLKVNEKEAVNLDHVKAITLVKRALFDPDLDVVSSSFPWTKKPRFFGLACHGTSKTVTI
jgi:hypothetical protein